MKITVLGAGLAGIVAHGAFASYAPQIYDARPQGQTGLSQHHAVMRLRDPNLGAVMGCDMEEIQVTKEIFSNGSLHREATIADNNLYSRKVSGIISHRSLNSLGQVRRYLLKGQVSAPGIFFSHKLKAILPNRKLVFDNNSQTVEVSYDVCISTLPMPYVLSILGQDLGVEFSSYDIYIAKGKLNFDSAVHQTVYFPEPQFDIYRATLEGQEFIAESMAKIDDAQIEKVLAIFGLRGEDFGNIDAYEQKQAKMVPVDDALRRMVILELTEKHNIFSLGRYAIWKPIRSDDLPTDINRIKSILRLDKVRRKYESRFA